MKRRAWAILLVCVACLGAGSGFVTTRRTHSANEPLCELRWYLSSRGGTRNVVLTRATKFTHCWVEVRCPEPFDGDDEAHWIWSPLDPIQAEMFPGRFRIICQEPWWPACMTGPHSRPDWLETDGCLRFDWNVDGDVDLHDFANWSRVK